MKKILYVTLIFCLGICTGCSDYLDTEPMSFTSISNFYKNQADAETALTGCYGMLQNSYSVNGRTGMFLIGDVGTDEIVGNPYSTPDAEANMDQFIFGRVVKSNLTIKNLWSTAYTGLYSINLLLSQLDKIDMPESSKDRIRAEARFLRGWHYYHLGMIYGGLPVFTSVPHAPDQKRNSLEQVMKQAIEDLQYAYNTLPGSAVSNSGRASKWAAAGYLTKLHCYLASSKKYGTGAALNFPLNSFDWVNVDESYAQAEQISQNIINSSGLKLTADYRMLFCEGSVAKQKEEMLFSLSASPQKRLGFSLNFYLLPVGSSGGGWGTCRPTQEVYSRYDTLYDARGNWVVGGLGVDPVTETIDGQVYFKPAKLKLSNGEAFDGDYCVNKFRQLRTEAKHDDVYYGQYPLLRLADIILLRAEAVGHLSGDEAGREILKMVRDRALSKARTTDVNRLQMAYRKTDFIAELLDERSRELCFEQQRKFDLVRFNRYASTIKSISTTRGVWNRNAAIQLVDNISDAKIWSPIPEEDEIINPNLKPNNPGY